jgi:hypothetical protein
VPHRRPADTLPLLSLLLMRKWEAQASPQVRVSCVVRGAVCARLLSCPPLPHLKGAEFPVLASLPCASVVATCCRGGPMPPDHSCRQSHRARAASRSLTPSPSCGGSALSNSHMPAATYVVCLAGIRQYPICVHFIINEHFSNHIITNTNITIHDRHAPPHAARPQLTLPPPLPARRPPPPPPHTLLRSPRLVSPSPKLRGRDASICHLMWIAQSDLPTSNKSMATTRESHRGGVVERRRKKQFWNGRIRMVAAWVAWRQAAGGSSGTAR